MVFLTGAEGRFHFDAIDSAALLLPANKDPKEGGPVFGRGGEEEPLLELLELLECSCLLLTRRSGEDFKAQKVQVKVGRF
jgi:hypothetical protein